jgi:hypothetical protein
MATQIKTQELGRPIAVLGLSGQPYVKPTGSIAEADKVAKEHNGVVPDLKDFIFEIRDPENLGKLLRGQAIGKEYSECDHYLTSDTKLVIKGAGTLGDVRVCKINKDGSLEWIDERQRYMLPPAQKAEVDGLLVAAYEGHERIIVSIGNYSSSAALYITAADTDRSYKLLMSYVPSTESEKR